MTLISQGVLAATPCSTALEFDPVLSKAELRAACGAKSRGVYIGAGGDGKVYGRVRRSRRGEFIYAAKIFDCPGNAETELATLRALHECERQGHLGSFRVIKPIRAYRWVMHLEFVEGRSLENIFESDEGRGCPARRAARDFYNDAVVEVCQRFRKLGYEVGEGFGRYLFSADFFPPEGVALPSFCITPANILIEARTKELIINDSL